MGGSSGGGGSSGSVDYPGYMKDSHSRYLTEIRNLLPAANPFISVNAPSVDRLLNNTAVTALGTHIAERIVEVNALNTTVSINVDLQLPALYTRLTTTLDLVLTYLNSSHNITLSDDYENFATSLYARLDEIENIQNVSNLVEFETVIRPRFLAGMRDINAVQSSMFVLGLSNMEAVYAAKMTEVKQGLKNDIWKLNADVKNQLAQLELETKKTNVGRTQNILTLVNQTLGIMHSTAASLDTVRVQLGGTLEQLRLEFMKLKEASKAQLTSAADQHAGKSVELSRMQVVALMEQSNVNIDYDEKQFRWDLENYQYLANMLAAIGSGTASAGGRQTSKFSSALGGALSGAATGAAISGGNPIGAAIGGVIGLGAGLF